MIVLLEAMNASPLSGLLVQKSRRYKHQRIFNSRSSSFTVYSMMTSVCMLNCSTVAG